MDEQRSMAQSTGDDSNTQADETEQASNDKIEDDTFEFRLFAQASKKANTSNNGRSTENTTRDTSTGERPSQQAPVQRIRLGSPQNNSINASQTARPLTYYIAAPATPAQRAQYAEAAMSGELVMQVANRPSPGLRLPWRVITWPAARFEGSVESIQRGGATATDERQTGVACDGRRTRKGKKSRLKVRRRAQALWAREESRRAEAAAEEEAQNVRKERAKEKTRLLNRKKQLKKRERQRERHRAEEAGTLELELDQEAVELQRR